MKRDVGILVGTILFVLYFLYFYLMDEEVNAGSLGTLGDFIGGNLNPILAFITTILLIETKSKWVPISIPVAQLIKLSATKYKDH